MATTDYVQDARERLISSIGDALERPATDAQQSAILAAIDSLIARAGQQALVTQAEAWVRIQTLVDAERGRVSAAETKLRLAVEDEEKRQAEIAACPTPVYHRTHNYCPSCPWRIDLDGDEPESDAEFFGEE